MAGSVVGRQLSQVQDIQYKEWQKKVWPTNTEEETTKAVGNEATTANKNTSPTSSMDALVNASITIDNNNREVEEDEVSGSKSSHGWW